MPTFTRLYENLLMDFFSSMQSFNKLAILNLGGVSGPGGGSGGPPGGIIGQLPQSRVTYDTTEAAVYSIPASGLSLVHNLNRIRHRITVIETEEITHQTIFTSAGNIYVSDINLRIYNRFGVPQTITEVFLSTDTAPTGSNIIVDIHKNGTTIFTNQSNRPVISSESTTGYTNVIDASGWDTGQYLTAHIDQVGSVNPGSNLVVHVIHHHHR